MTFSAGYFLKMRQGHPPVGHVDSLRSCKRSCTPEHVNNAKKRISWGIEPLPTSSTQILRNCPSRDHFLTVDFFPGGKSSFGATSVMQNSPSFGSKGLGLAGNWFQVFVEGHLARPLITAPKPRVLESSGDESSPCQRESGGFT